MKKELQHLFRMDKLPHMWCPGCGNGIILRAIAEAIEDKIDDFDKTVVVSGIGCSSRATGYMNFDTVHTTHGRALAFATGIKLADPELNVFVITGDGDCTAIGGNHLIHAARRNIDLNVIVFNNNIYGMTGGQYSPTTPHDKIGTTAPYGNLEREFDIPKLAIAAGATYVAKSTTWHQQLIVQSIKEGIDNKGFSLTEVITMCPTSYGRRNKMGDAGDMLLWQKNNSIMKTAADKLPPEKTAGKIIIGKLHEEKAPEYTEQYDSLIASLKGRQE